MEINTERIRDEMKNRNQWLCWEAAMRDGKETKLPKDPATGGFAQTDDPSTWGSFINANGKVRSGEMDGVGFVFTEGDNFVGIDLDDCRDPDTGEWEDWALDVMQDIGGWIEISPSGTGAHIILKGEIPGDRNRKGSIEIYEDGRFFTVTGQLVDEEGVPLNEDENTPEIKEAQQALDAVYDRFLAEDDDTANETNVDVDSSQWGHLDLEDHGEESSTGLSTGPSINDLDPSLREIINTAKSANNGYQFTQLWRGNWESNYPSHSEADLAFCDMLAFWFSGDPERMDRVFRASGLMRPKWDDVRYSDGSTYGERTIEKAVATVDDHYDEEHYDDLVDESKQDTDPETDPLLDPDSSGNRKQDGSPSSDEQSETRSQEDPPDQSQPSDEDSSSQSSDDNSATQNATTSRGRGRRREGGRKRSTQRRSEIPDDVANSQSESTVSASSSSDTRPGNGGSWGDDSSTDSPTELDVDSNPDTWEEDDSAFINDPDDEEDEGDESDQTIEDELGISGEEAQANVEEMDKDNETSSPSSRDSKSAETSDNTQSDDGESRAALWEETDDQDLNEDSDGERQTSETTVDVGANETGRDSEGSETEPERNSSEGANKQDDEETEEYTLEDLRDRQAEFEKKVRKRLNSLEDTTNKHGKKFSKRETSPLLSDIEDNKSHIQQVRSDLHTARSQIRGDLELEDDKLERVHRELQRKEETLDKREDQLQTMFQLFVLLCHAQPEQLFDRIESIFIAAGEVPEENIFEESIGEIIDDYEGEMAGFENSRSNEFGTGSRMSQEGHLDGTTTDHRSENGEDTEEDDGTFLSQFF